MRKSRITDTISFRLSALYLGLFIFSFLAMGVAVYFLTTRILEQQMMSGVELEVLELKTEYSEGGISALKNDIAAKEKTTAGIMHNYGILDSQSRAIAGHIKNFEPADGWQKIPVLSGEIVPGDDGNFLKVKVIKLDDSFWLGVGYNVDYVADAGEAIIAAFSWGALLVVILGAISGYYISRAFLNKIQSITKSTQAIIAGDLKHRLHVSENRDEMDNLALLLNRMLDKIGTLIENVQEVSNDIAHDLRTPISRLKFKLEDILRKDLAAHELKERINSAIGEIDTILDTFSALLRISQIESGSRRSGFCTLDFSSIVQSVVEALGPVAEEKNHRLSCAIENQVNLTGDKELLTQLVFNLMENAIIHTPANAEIAINLQKTGKKILFTVDDTGQGIPEEQREKVFQRFYRLERSRTTPGNGLGLSIVAAIIELHDARLILSDNAPGLRVSVEFADS